MKLKIGQAEIPVTLVEDRKSTITVHTAHDTDITTLKNAVEGVTEITYTDDDDNVVYRIYGTYHLKFVGGEDNGLKFVFSKTDTLEARIAALEAANDTLEAANDTLEAANETLAEELTATQLALAELSETLLEADSAAVENAEGGAEE